MKAPEYYGRPRREMLPYLPANAGSVLDIGCGAGAFAAGLRQARSADLRIEGIELDEAAAGRATEVLDAVHTGDAVEILQELDSGPFDCIVMNDVIEHVQEPGDLLRAAARVLAPGGAIVASVPNVRYFFNVVNLAVHGRWEYTDEGILDRTHLRFFTRSSIRAHFAEAGFGVETIHGINPTGSAKFKLVNLLTLGRWADMKYLQFAVVARAGS